MDLETFSHKSVVSPITDEKNMISSKTLICRQLLAGQVVGSQSMKKRALNGNSGNVKVMGSIPVEG